MYAGEKFNAYSHLAGTLLAVSGLVLMLWHTVPQNDAYRITGAAVYGACLVLLYLGSTVYHSVRPPRAKAILQKMDHCAIYLLIAGSYTPFTLVTLRGAWGWSLLAAVWSLCVFGIVQELTLGRRTRKLSMILYVLMGWMVLVAAYPLVKNLPAWGGCFGWHWAAYCTARAFIGLSTMKKSVTDTVFGICLYWAAACRSLSACIFMLGLS